MQVFNFFSLLCQNKDAHHALDLKIKKIHHFHCIFINFVHKNIYFAGRLKTNMGNLCFHQGNYPKAIKFYRMALDQVPNTHRDMR